MVFFKHPFQLLANPGGRIPFHQQGIPIPDPLQQHFGWEQREVAKSAYNTSNRLPLGRFLGTDWTQKNQPEFLSGNERIAFEGQW
jgi:hypothetical protein